MGVVKLFIVISRELDYQSDRARGAENIVEVLNTSNCVLEKYKYKDIKDVADKVGINGLTKDRFCQLRFSLVKSLLGNRLYCGNREVFYNGKIAFWLNSSIPGFNIISESGCLVKCYSSAYSHNKIAIQYAEKLGKYYRVCFRIEAIAGFTGVSGIHLLCIFDEERFLGVEDLLYTPNKISSFQISDAAKLSGDLQARLKICSGV